MKTLAAVSVDEFLSLLTSKFGGDVAEKQRARVTYLHTHDPVGLARAYGRIQRNASKWIAKRNARKERLEAEHAARPTVHDRLIADDVLDPPPPSATEQKRRILDALIVRAEFTPSERRVLHRSANKGVDALLRAFRSRDPQLRRDLVDFVSGGREDLDLAECRCLLGRGEIDCRWLSSSLGLAVDNYGPWPKAAVQALVGKRKKHVIKQYHEGAEWVTRVEGGWEHRGKTYESSVDARAAAFSANQRENDRRRRREEAVASAREQVWQRLVSTHGKVASLVDGSWPAEVVASYGQHGEVTLINGESAILTDRGYDDDGHDLHCSSAAAKLAKSLLKMKTKAGLVGSDRLPLVTLQSICGASYTPPSGVALRSWETPQSTAELAYTKAPGG